jgi:hypothetical protein
MLKRIFATITIIGCLTFFPAPSYSYSDRVPGGGEMMEFVTPDDRKVERLVEEITAECDDKWEGYYTIHYWVRENIDYESDDGEDWKYPKETIRDEEGDCEDMACLRCSMLIAYDQMIEETDDRWYVLLVAISREEKLGFHGSVIGNVEGYAQIYDYDFDNYGDIVEVDELEEVWEDYEDFGGAEVIPQYVFNGESYEELSGLESLKEFLSG